MIDVYQFRNLVRETLREFEIDGGPKVTPEAVDLLMMISAHESHLGTYLKQVGGPALGVFQMEPATFSDIFENYLKYDRQMLRRVSGYFVKNYDPEPWEMTWNLKVAIVMARVHFLRNPQKIPLDTEGQARYAKKWWNTSEGKATADDYHKAYLDRGL